MLILRISTPLNTPNFLYTNDHLTPYIIYTYSVPAICQEHRFNMPATYQTPQSHSKIYKPIYFFIVK